MCNYFNSENAYLYQEAEVAMSAHTGIAATPSIESLTFHDICHYIGSDFEHARVKPDQRCSRSVLLTCEGGKNNKIHVTHVSHRKFSQCFSFCPAIQTLKENTTLFCPKLSNPKQNGFANYCFQTRLHNVVVFSSPWPTWKFPAHFNTLFKAWGITWTSLFLD